MTNNSLLPPRSVSASSWTLGRHDTRVRAALTFALCVAVAAVADVTVREPARFAAGALGAAPPGALTTFPDDWPPLVPDCTAAYLNASVGAAEPLTTVVRVEVPAGRAVSLRGCRSSNSGGGGEAAPMWHVRLVLAMGRSSAVALMAWDVTLGGVTIEGPAGNASSVVDALVVVGGGSRIVAGTSGGARAASSDPAEDVHALSVVAPKKSGPVATLSVSGLGLVVADGSVVRAEHDGAGLLYATACVVRAEAPPNPGSVAGPASLVERLRVVVTGGSKVEASTTDSGAVYDFSRGRHAHAATIQAMPGARATATQVVVAVLQRSTASAFGDDGSSVAGGLSVSARVRGTPNSYIGTAVTLTHATLIAAGPDTTVRVTTKGRGYGVSAMGVAAYRSGAVASMVNSNVYAVGPNTTVAVHITGGYGSSVSAMGVAAYGSGATASMTNTTVYAVGPNTTVTVHITEGSGRGASAMGVANSGATASMTNTTVYAVGPNTSVALRVDGGSGSGASAMGIANADAFDTAEPNTVARCPNVHVVGEGAADIVVFNASLHPNVAFSTPSLCPPVPQLPGIWPVGEGGDETETPSASRSARSVSRSRSVSPLLHTRTRTVPRSTITTTAADVVIVSSSTTATTSLPSTASPRVATLTPAAARFSSATASVTVSPHRPSAPPETQAAAGLAVAASPVQATASVSVFAGVLLPASVSKPMANARVLQVADMCLSVVGGDEALENTEPGEWPSDYAVIVARWNVGGGGGGEGSAARARAAGAAVAVVCAAVAGAASVVRFASPAASAAAHREGSGAGDDGGDAAPASRSSAPAVAFAVAAAYLVPNALEAAVGAATAGLDGTTGAAGVVAACVMVAAMVPVFAASVVTDDRAEPVSASLAGRVAGFLHPVIVDGLRDEASPLLRSHALLDFAAACVIAAASGATQAGVRLGGSCVLLVLIMTATAMGLTAYYALVRPFAARLEVAVATAQTGMLAVLCGLTLAAVLSGGAAVSEEALEVAGLAAEAVTFGAPVVLVAPVVWAWLRGRDRGKSEDTTAVAVPLVVSVGGPRDAEPADGDGDAALLTLPVHSDRAAPPKMARAATKGRCGDDGDDGKAHQVHQNPLAAAPNEHRKR